ncbi:MAG: hypothetical protein IKC56_02035 [Clostridia bacterium]|nr:hypothetical protein [Clostridia bacterium]
MLNLLLPQSVKVGNAWYFMFIALGVIATIGLYFLLRGKSYRTKYNVLYGIIIANFILHFLKLAFQPYRGELPASIRKVSFENICAVSTLIFPFLYRSRKQAVKNYVFFIGVVGGLAAFLYPTNAIEQTTINFDTFRFYINHWGLVAVPLVSACVGIIKVNYKKCWVAPVFFLIIEYVILFNEVAVMKLGWLNWTETNTQTLLDRNFRNNSFVFGPMDAYGKVTGFITAFVPDFMTKSVFGLNGGIDFYWPVVWMIIPAFIYLPLFFLALAAPFTYKEMYADGKAFIAKIKNRKKEAEEIQPQTPSQTEENKKE